MIRWLAACAAWLPLPALALSCMPWDVENAFTEADESAEAYVVVSGDLAFDVDMLPVVDWSDQIAVPPFTEIPARLTGFSLTSEGFSAPFEAEVTLKIGCAGPWCASAQPGPSLAFLKQTPAGWVLAQGPCGGFYFGDPAQDVLARVAVMYAGAQQGR